MAGIKIINCSCPHEYQDKKYGYGRRVANLMKSGTPRCTVCGKSGDSSSSEKSK